MLRPTVYLIFYHYYFFRSTVSVTMLNVSSFRLLYLPQSLFAAGRIDRVNGIGHRNTEPFPIPPHKITNYNNIIFYKSIIPTYTRENVGLARRLLNCAA